MAETRAESGKWKFTKLERGPVNVTRPLGWLISAYLEAKQISVSL